MVDSNFKNISTQRQICIATKSLTSYKVLITNESLRKIPLDITPLWRCRTRPTPANRTPRTSWLLLLKAFQDEKGELMSSLFKRNPSYRWSAYTREMPVKKAYANYLLSTLFLSLFIHEILNKYMLFFFLYFTVCYHNIKF